MINEFKDDDYEEGRAPLPLRQIDNTNWSQFDIVIPDNVVRFEDVVPIAINRLKPGDIINCVLGALYDLSKFWIIDKAAINNNFFTNLESFYSTPPPNYNVSPQLVREELYCIAVFFGSHMRCTILKVLDNQPGFVQVFLIDIGTIYCVPFKDLYYLNKRFADVPALAIRARLANIVPLRRNDLWTGKAICRFYDILKAIQFRTEVVAVDRDMVLDVLVKTPLRNFFINYVLVDEGYALRKNEEHTKPKFNDPDCIPLVDNIHLYPTFDEIENGVVANQNIQYIVCHMLPAHWYMPSYFNITLSWTNSVFDEVQINCEKNIKNNQLRNDTKISIIEEDHFDTFLINVKEIRALEYS